MKISSRRQFLRDLGLTAGALPFVAGLPSLGLGAAAAPGRKQRVIFMASPNGTIQPNFWPDQLGGEFELKRILEPLAPFKDRMLTLKGISNRVGGDGDRHMRGMSCLLTGIELFPGNIQGGSDTPAGWASGISIDQEIKNFLQSKPETATRFGSLELGVAVPDRADPWTRWSYAGPNKPLAPIDDPYQLFEKLYGQMKDRDDVASIMDALKDDLQRISKKVSAEDKALLGEHLEVVRSMEKELQAAGDGSLRHPEPELEAGVANGNDNIPAISKMQTDLLVNAMANDMARVATLQYTRSVGQARFRWLGIDDGQHSLSHEPDGNADAQEKLTKINRWYAEQLAYLAKRLAETPEPGGEGSMLDNTLIIWTNELGKGNTHTLDDLPFVCLGGAPGFKMGQAHDFHGATHNRLWMSVAHAFGHPIETFGNKRLSQGGALDLSTDAKVPEPKPAEAKKA